MPVHQQVWLVVEVHKFMVRVNLLQGPELNLPTPTLLNTDKLLPKPPQPRKTTCWNLRKSLEAYSITYYLGVRDQFELDACALVLTEQLVTLFLGRIITKFLHVGS